MAVKTPAARGRHKKRKKDRMGPGFVSIEKNSPSLDLDIIWILLHTLNTVTFISNSRPFSMAWSSNCGELMLGSLRTLIRVRARHCSPHWTPPTLQLGYPVKNRGTTKHDQTRYLPQRLGLQTALLPVQINPQGNLDPSKFIKTHQNKLISPGFEAISLVDLFFKGLNPVKSFRFAMPSFCCHEGLVFNDYVSLGHEAPSAASVVLDSDLVAIVVEIDTKVN